LLVDARGAPSGVVVAGAHRPDVELLAATLASLPIARPDPRTTPQDLCLDKAYTGQRTTRLGQTRGYDLHLPDRANAKKSGSVNRVGGKRAAEAWKSPMLG
jgi:hypothetical protein